MSSRGVKIYASQSFDELQQFGFRWCKKDCRWERSRKLCSKKGERKQIEAILPEGVRIEE